MPSPRKFLILLLKFYRYWLSPWLGSACRFSPTCSAYVQQALQTHGAGTGSYLGLCRVLRCHPWCAGGIDPVPVRRVQQGTPGSALRGPNHE